MDFFKICKCDFTFIREMRVNSSQCVVYFDCAPQYIIHGLLSIIWTWRQKFKILHAWYSPFFFFLIQIIKHYILDQWHDVKFFWLSEAPYIQPIKWSMAKLSIVIGPMYYGKPVIQKARKTSLGSIHFATIFRISHPDRF